MDPLLWPALSGAGNVIGPVPTAGAANTRGEPVARRTILGPLMVGVGVLPGPA